MSPRVVFAEVPQFYAAVERAADPALASRPVIVGGNPRKRGLVQAATPDALGDGVRVDMPVSEALERCPRARVIRTDMNRYREVSRRLFACLRRSFERLEPFGLGAAYFDVSGDRRGAEAIADALREAVAAELSLPVRTGAGAGKFVARLAAEEAADGTCRSIADGEEADFLGPLPATRLEGVGEKTAATLAELGAHTIGDVTRLDPERLQGALGNHGLRILALATGRDRGRVEATSAPKSLSREVTVAGEDGGGGVVDAASLSEPLFELARALQGELQLQSLHARTLTLKLRFADGSRMTRALTFQEPTAAVGAIEEAALRLLERSQAGSRPVRGIGLQAGKLLAPSESDRQLDLFSSRP